MSAGYSPSLLALLALGVLSGCGERTASKSGERTATADSVAAPVTEQPTDSTLVALGNEPFWNVRVTMHEILYRDPEHQEGYRFPPVVAVKEGDARVYRTRRGPGGEVGPRDLELRIRRGDCSDGMSDRQYSMTAALTLDGYTRTGCAFHPDNPPWGDSARP